MRIAGIAKACSESRPGKLLMCIIYMQLLLSSKHPECMQTRIQPSGSSAASPRVASRSCRRSTISPLQCSLGCSLQDRHMFPQSHHALIVTAQQCQDQDFRFPKQPIEICSWGSFLQQARIASTCRINYCISKAHLHIQSTLLTHVTGRAMAPLESATKCLYRLRSGICVCGFHTPRSRRPFLQQQHMHSLTEAGMPDRGC